MFRSSNNFDKLLDEVTNSYELDINWDTVLKICELIRQGDISPKDALKKITKKIGNSNQHTAMYGLQVLESCVKNCGSLIQTEISTKEYMEQYKDLIEKCTHDNVKTKALDLLQSWAHAFRQIPKYRPVNDTMNIMKHEGYKFPVFRESEAMFSAEVAPAWKDSTRCHRCRSEFTLTLRKHHCRACGEVFCYQCSSQNICLPKFGIEKEVRVCISCYERHKNNPTNSSNIGKESNESPKHLSLQRGKRRPHKSRKSSPSWSKTTLKSGNSNGGTAKREELPSEYVASSLATQNQYPPAKKTEEELNEEEEFQLALALSESELESKRSSSYRPVTRTKSFSPPVSQKMNQYENEDPELSRYLNRTYWDTRASSTDRSTDPDVKRATSVVTNNYEIAKDRTEQNGLRSECEIDEFVSTLRDQVEIFVNRMKSNSSRGRSISNDTSVQTLFMNITAMHSKLLRYIQQHDDSRVYYEGLQDKLTQVKDARAALDALRDEYRERLRREAEHAERQRQIQMAQKLEIMRQKKQEYLQYQRQLALQRVRDQEREMHLRQEQQKQQYRLASGPYGTGPYMGSSQGVASAFEPVTSMGMSMNNLPLGGANVPYAQTSFPQYTHGQPVAQQQMMPPQQQPMMMGQPQMPSNSYVSGNHPPPGVMVASNQNVAHGPIGPGQQPSTQYPVNQPSKLHTAANLNPQTQSIHVDSQNPQGAMGAVHLDPGAHAILSPQSSRIEPNPHVMRQLSGPPQPGSMLQHPNMVRPMMPPSSSPLSSPSSSSEHSIIQHGPQPMPSAPSATTTPLPEEKEDVAELISFD